MGNIHIFIADELHERLRKVCRHKVTQQKFLEEGIEKLVSDMESSGGIKKIGEGRIQPERFRDYKSLIARDGIRPPTEQEVTVFLDGFTPYEKEEEVGLELSSSAIVDEAGGEKEKGPAGASYYDRDKLPGSEVFLVDRERVEKYGGPSDDIVMGINTANIQIPSKATVDSWYEGDEKESAPVLKRLTLEDLVKEEEVACEGVAISPQYYVPDAKEDE